MSKIFNAGLRMKIYKTTFKPVYARKYIKAYHNWVVITVFRTTGKDSLDLVAADELVISDVTSHGEICVRLETFSAWKKKVDEWIQRK